MKGGAASTWVMASACPRKGSSWPDTSRARASKRYTPSPDAVNRALVSVVHFIQSIHAPPLKLYWMS